ncbi:MAG: NTP transferase domain-containing protein [Rhodospirillaceae bacterium]|jgi:molybdenum cofactor cytidylyltransferase|nr:NTP transferase domain-containing protein [Rhodospirillaceae bacterium]MBT5564474.1 NTP transferase domain-containing protein [Rhodospirillaceae bacterium]MBT6089764.1 NTP transferase domain-containing protein [Rhodospirillaceae bacterium]MBT7451308.1 NTP transferase domain-containing protein [Rhodospirillaceae bacterium]
MIFSEIPVDDAEGAILAHTTRSDGWTLKKGHRLTAEDCRLLSAAGITVLRAAKLEDGDVREDAAAKEIADGASGDSVTPTAAHTGRCNLVATIDGVIRIDADTVNRINAIDESITIATLPDYARVNAGQTIATIKIIPFAVGERILAAVMQALNEGDSPVSIEPFQALSVVLINSILPTLKDSVVTKTTALTKRRLGALGGTVNHVLTCQHDESEIADSVARAAEHHPDLVVVIGASVTVDRSDVVPAGIVKAGGVIEHFGMPVDPGNLMLLAEHSGTPVLVLPGCARSPKLNGIDWVLERFAARLPVTRDVISGLGVGGLLVDSPARPMPRDEAVLEFQDRNTDHVIGAVVLAAGQSRRMGPINKLLEPINEVPLIRHTVERVLASKVDSVVVVTGHQSREVEQALSGLKVIFAHNPEFEGGLSTSLGAGLTAVPNACSGAVVCLGDMPGILSDHINALIDQFDPEAGRSIGVPVHLGKRGNPIVWARRFFDAMADVSGDVGARHLIGANVDLVYEVDFEDTAVLTDLDTPEQWAKFHETDAL